jgi:hypothetical protein
LPSQADDTAISLCRQNRFNISYSVPFFKFFSLTHAHTLSLPLSLSHTQADGGAVGLETLTAAEMLELGNEADGSQQPQQPDEAQGGKVAAGAGEVLDAHKGDDHLGRE